MKQMMMYEHRLCKGIKLLKKTILVMTGILFFLLFSIRVFATEAEVTATSAKVRKEASSTSEVVAGVTKGMKVTIEEEVKDSDGKVWYKVGIGGNNYGYIRSDLVSKGTSGNSSSSGTSDSSTAQNTSTPAPTVPTAIEEQTAILVPKGANSARIRSGASTSHDVVNSIPEGTLITLIGQATNSSGEKWYQMTCTYNGNTIEGYVRSDLVSMDIPADTPGDTSDGSGDAIDGEGGDDGEGGEDGAELDSPEDTDVDQQGMEPEQTPEQTNKDYEIVYKQNEEGVYEYYFWDHISNGERKVSEILAYMNYASEDGAKLQKQVTTDKIIIIILAVIIIILVLVVTILIFKIRDLYYEETDDEDEDDEEEEEPVVRRSRKKAIEEPELRAASRTESRRPSQARTRSQSDAPSRSSSRASSKTSQRTPERREDRQERNRPKSTPAKKPQNFIVDDEFEFEFLNMDDKE